VKARLGLAVAAAATALAIACGGVSAPAAPSGHVTLRLGYFQNLGHAPALVGLKKGFFASTLGSQVTLQTATFNAGPDEVEALLSRSLDVAYMGPNPAITAYVRSHGQAVRIISGATSGGSALVVKPSITSAADLRGKTVASPQLGNTQDVALRWWLGQRGLKTGLQGGGDVTVQPLDNATALQAFKAGQIAGAWVSEPWVSRLQLEAGGKLLVDERDLWPGGRFVTVQVVVRTEFLNRNRAVVERLLEGQFEAGEYLRTYPGDAQKLVGDALGELTGKRLPDATVAAAWSRLAFTEDPLAGTLKQASDHAVQLGLTPKADLSRAYDLSLLNQVLARHGRPAVKGL